jgi:aryl-alcohol dehydrogenase-like predicted oxidoreductase
MDYAHLGRAGVLVSKLCLGTMNFGPYTSEEEAQRIMDHALARGINFFDTADVYGREAGFGTTESIIGRWSAQGGGRREKVVLATKVYGSNGEWPNESRLSARHIRAACEGSLRRLQTDCIDLYQMHHIDRQTPWEEIWQAMEQLYREGKILYAGSSNFAGWHIAEAQEVAQQRHFMGLVSEQSLYNLTVRAVELEVLPACRHYGLGVLPWSPLAGGLLGGVLKKESEGRRAGDDIQQALAQLREQVQAYEQLCDELGEPPAVVALAWLLHQPAVTAPIIGPRKLQQLNDALHALEITLPPEVMTRLDTIFPGPGGPAPEAYAW